MTARPLYQISAADAAGRTSEAAWRRSVMEGAAWAGWQVALQIEDALYRDGAAMAKVRPGLRSALRAIEGWPDVVIVHPVRALTVYVEFKTDVGTVSAEQRTKIALLLAGGMDVRVWRPRMWIAEVRPTLQDLPLEGTPGIEEAAKWAARAAVPWRR